MSFTRTDLLELGFDALVALANAGFVKRAQKDIAAGDVPLIEELIDGTVKAEYVDGVISTLPPGRALREATCTCPASNLCRHRVMLVLAYQQRAQAAQVAQGDGAGPGNNQNSSSAASGEAVFWTPADFTDEAIQESLSASARAQAEKMLLDRPAVTLEPYSTEQPIPSARFPMCTVRFFSRSALVHARCDCKEGSGCAHVALAIEAFRELRRLGLEAFGTVQTIELKPQDAAKNGVRHPSVFQEPLAQTTRENIVLWLQKLWDEGSAHCLSSLEADTSPLKRACQELGWRWVEEKLSFISQLIHAQQARSNRFDPLALLRSVCGLWARLEAAHCVDQTMLVGQPATSELLPARQILGVGVKGETAMDHLKLVSLGMRLWSEKNAIGEKNECRCGANIVFVDTDTQTLMQLERDWLLSEGGSPEERWHDLMNRRVAGQPLRLFAESQIVTKAASRKANGQFELAANARQSNFFPLSPNAWDALLFPIRQNSVQSFYKFLQNRMPAFVTPYQAIGQFHVFYPDQLEVVDVFWDAAKQILYAHIINDVCGDANENNTLLLELPYDELVGHSVDLAAKVCAGELGALKAIAGEARLDSGQIVMRPWSLMTQEEIVVLGTHSFPGKSMALTPGVAPQASRSKVIGDVLSLFSQCLRQGTRYQNASIYRKILELSKALHHQGFIQSAGRLSSLLDDYLVKYQILPCSELTPYAILLFEMRRGE